MTTGISLYTDSSHVPHTLLERKWREYLFMHMQSAEDTGYR